MRMKGFGAYMNVVLQPNKPKTKARIPLAVSKNDLAAVGVSKALVSVCFGTKNDS